MQLGASQCLAFEDSGNGLQAATAAGIATILTPTHYTLHHDFAQALRVVPDLRQVNLDTLMQWHAQHLQAKKPLALKAAAMTTRYAWPHPFCRPTLPAWAKRCAPSRQRVPTWFTLM
jgi:hypothetical protein